MQSILDYLVIAGGGAGGQSGGSGGGGAGGYRNSVAGETWCINFFKGGVWKQTSYNNNFRKAYAGIGMIYDPVKDKFLSSQPHASWSLDASDDWQAPITYPTVTDDGATPSVWSYIITWNEENLKWTATDNSDPVNNFNWDASALAWVSA